jgi:hypothetical protein
MPHRSRDGRFDMANLPIVCTLGPAALAARRDDLPAGLVISIEPDGGPVWLEFSGPPGTREFLTGLLGE